MVRLSLSSERYMSYKRARRGASRNAVFSPAAGVTPLLARSCHQQVYAECRPGSEMRHAYVPRALSAGDTVKKARGSVALKMPRRAHR